MYADQHFGQLQLQMQRMQADVAALAGQLQARDGVNAAITSSVAALKSESSAGASTVDRKLEAYGGAIKNVGDDVQNVGKAVAALKAEVGRASKENLPQISDSALAAMKAIVGVLESKEHRCSFTVGAFSVS